MTTIPAGELEVTLADLDTYALLDVRERGEYALGHIPGACPLPRGLVEVLAPTLVPWTKVPLVLYCDDGHRSTLAAGTLREMGYQDVRVVDGGIEAWAALGRVPEEGVNVLGKTYGEKVSTIGGVEQLDPDEVAALQSQGGTLVLDARTEVEHRRGHIPGAVNIPGGELAEQLLSIPQPDSPDTIVVHCAGRTRSIVGAQLVNALGFEKVYALRNGTMAWRMSGRELEYDPRHFTTPVTDEGRARAAQFAARFVKDQGVEPWSASEVVSARHAGRPLYLLDVRQVDEFAAGRPAGAINCPVGQLANAADEQLAVRSAAIVCYSNDETRARIGAGLLRRIGYPNVGWLRGGWTAWRDSEQDCTDGALPSYPAALDTVVDGRDPVSVQEAAAASAAGQVKLIDVRRSSEFALGHIRSSRWVPRGDLERRLSGVAEVDDDLVLVSDRGVRAALAAATARSLGYARVRVLTGGFEAWKAAGLPIEQGLEGADVDLREAKEDAELVAPRPAMLERNREDMVRYLTWEEQLGRAFEGATGV
jgi:rhodanese-related sulfurtransferase